MRNTVPWRPPGTRHPAVPYSLYANGTRKYLNRAERLRALTAMMSLEPDAALFAQLLAWTGARLSEVILLVPASFQIEACVVSIPTLKRREPVVREVPIPPPLMQALDTHFDLRAAQRDPERAYHPLWPCHRVTGWRIIKIVMRLAQIIGRAACPRGLRHSFGVAAVQARVPLPMIQRWFGHSRLESTAIYTGACGPDEVEFAARIWEQSGADELYSVTSSPSIQASEAPCIRPDHWNEHPALPPAEGSVPGSARPCSRRNVPADSKI